MNRSDSVFAASYTHLEMNDERDTDTNSSFSNVLDSVREWQRQARLILLTLRYIEAYNATYV